MSAISPATNRMARISFIDRGRWIAIAFLMAVVICTLAVLIGLGIEGYRTLRLMQANNNFKTLLLGLHEYHNQYGQFPPVVERNENGIAIHSWRTHVLPDLPSKVQRDYGFSEFDFRKPWNDPGNQAAADRHGLARYNYQMLAIVGPGAAWDSHGTRKLADFKDGSANTMLIIALRNTGIPWHEPRDAQFDGETLWLGDPSDRRPVPLTEDLFLLMADGSIHYCISGISPQTLRALITIDGDDDPGKVW